MKTLLIGGARSGKSALAQRWAAERSAGIRASGGATDVCVVVTATASDPEMTARIAAHRQERPQQWRVREAPIALGRAVREEDSALILLDCLTLWVSNCLWPDPAVWPRERADFLDALGSCAADVIVVTNEVGSGIVPDNEAARAFRDAQGWLNQAVAQVCDEVFFVTAGLPLRLKPR